MDTGGGVEEVQSGLQVQEDAVKTRWRGTECGGAGSEMIHLNFLQVLKRVTFRLN